MVIKFIKSNAVLLIALLLAVATSIVVPPDKEYISYFDFKTLTCLFLTLSVICALKNVSFFQITARKLVCLFKNTRSVILSLVYITFIGSMIIANDMALITFLPLGYFVLDTTDNKDKMAFLFIMQTIAANLGGMLTPFGNPQNLYLYSHFNIPTLEFIETMLFPFLISTLFITACCLFIKKEPLELKNDFDFKYSKERTIRTIAYIILFLASLLIVFRIIPYVTGLIIITILLALLDYRAILSVDYGLLLTFCAFFIFSGNVSRIDLVKDIMESIINKNVLLTGTLSCQVISNVPSAILLSKFTSNYKELLVAVNIGGTGTLISSLASLITFREYMHHNKGGAKKYILKYSLYNFSILILLLVIMSIMFK